MREDFGCVQRARATQQLCSVTSLCRYVGPRYSEHQRGKHGKIASLCLCLGRPLPAGDRLPHASKETATMDVPQSAVPGHGQDDDDSNAESQQSSEDNTEEATVERTGNITMPRKNRRKSW
ncbi:hypothetical protein E2C01_098403 [Portunus trituberculatus]|uniref:Uncharacterized protein n=1 Tax=Portunus trituberculatus TaxID=210409 RepID=A0A5B7KCT4_PORTR|nr:hypothetical protein [Portunus trituberculatus]